MVDDRTGNAMARSDRKARYKMMRINTSDSETTIVNRLTASSISWNSPLHSALYGA
jgi:hypothetical protein